MRLTHGDPNKDAACTHGRGNEHDLNGVENIKTQLDPSPGATKSIDPAGSSSSCAATVPTICTMSDKGKRDVSWTDLEVGHVSRVLRIAGFTQGQFSLQVHLVDGIVTKIKHSMLGVHLYMIVMLAIGAHMPHNATHVFMYSSLSPIAQVD